MDLKRATEALQHAVTAVDTCLEEEDVPVVSDVLKDRYRLAMENAGSFCARRVGLALLEECRGMASGTDSSKIMVASLCAVVAQWGRSSSKGQQ